MNDKMLMILCIYIPLINKNDYYDSFDLTFYSGSRITIAIWCTLFSTNPTAVYFE